MAVKLIDKGLDLIQRKLKELKTLALTIGFQGETGLQLYDTGINVATVATFAEFGTQDAPARSFLRASMFEFRDKIARFWAAGVQRMLARTAFTPEMMLARVGRAIVKLVERKIRNAHSWAKPNAPSTVAKKGSAIPLHDTLLLSRSVTWAVRGSSGVILATGGSSG